MEVQEKCSRTFSSNAFYFSQKEMSHPSVFSVGDKCLHKLTTFGNDQVVAVSGDSGAGKTTVTQQLLCYFIDKSCRAVTPNSLDKKVLHRLFELEIRNQSWNMMIFNRSFLIDLLCNYNSGILGKREHNCKSK